MFIFFKPNISKKLHKKPITFTMESEIILSKPNRVKLNQNHTPVLLIYRSIELQLYGEKEDDK
jgi:hypothetical protein